MPINASRKRRASNSQEMGNRARCDPVPLPRPLVCLSFSAGMLLSSFVELVYQLAAVGRVPEFARRVKGPVCDSRLTGQLLANQGVRGPYDTVANRGKLPPQ
jgi:hypothetical protein